jgi:hypothetical protein
MQIAKIKMQNEKLKQIRQDKELEYGSFDANMNYIGKAWSALLGLETDIPGHMVANMYVVAKLIRTNQKFKQDTYDDAANYLYQAELMQKEKHTQDDLDQEKMIEKIALSKRKDAIDQLHRLNLETRRKLDDSN